MSRQTLEGKRAYNRAWRAANPDKVRAYAEKKRQQPGAKEAIAAYNRAYHAANKQQIKAKQKEWYVANKEKIIADRLAYKTKHRDKINAQERARYHEQKHIKYEQRKRNWTRNNQRRPALVLAKNEALLGRKRPDACDACGGNDGGIVFDHCHEKLHPRGWLCDRCNIALGCLRDDIDRLRRLIAYLKRTKNGMSTQYTLSGV